MSEAVVYEQFDETGQTGRRGAAPTPTCGASATSRWS